MARIREMRGGKDYDADFATRMKGSGLWADLIRQRFEKATNRIGFNRAAHRARPRRVPATGRGGAGQPVLTAAARWLSRPSGPPPDGAGRVLGLEFRNAAAQRLHFVGMVLGIGRRGVIGRGFARLALGVAHPLGRLLELVLAGDDRPAALPSAGWRPQRPR